MDNEQRREKDKQKLFLINEEIKILEKEKEMDTNFMIEIQDKKEIKKRIKQKSKTVSINDKTKNNSKLINNQVINSLNSLIFELINLPLEYILINSNKMVLTEEWKVSQLEKEVVKNQKYVMDLISKKLFLEEKTVGIFPNVEIAKRGITKSNQIKRNTLKELISKISGKPDYFPIKSNQNIPIKQNNNQDPDRYKNILNLFSLMRANKSKIRYKIQSKKFQNQNHSSHNIFIEKNKDGIPELIKYKNNKALVNEEKNRKQGKNNNNTG
ncbi:hypothetical protein NERG_00858 [Nematocida ausubeli]|uniref:Uncharacterized protein n=1 Tax=Nematocida ausubeli (strain ATCC PRA-371 / ERTm2) TaxID=1913371 RepID=H8ZBA9_NEMA1|nr:hypothetical protein NERG_00858 [Nematocida ausubeli]